MSSNVYIKLSGDNWVSVRPDLIANTSESLMPRAQASRSAGFLAVEISTGIVVAACLFFVHSFRWTFRGKTDTFRTSAFILAIISAIMYV